MTPQDKENIRKALPSQHATSITMVPSDKPSDINDRMKRFCDQLKTIVPHVRIKKDPDATFQAPALIAGRHANIAYRAIPEGKMVQRFLDALTQQFDPVSINDPGIENQLDRIKLPVALKVYVAAQCPHCPTTLKQVQSLAGASSKFRLTVIDAALFPESAQNDEVRAVPTIILDDQLRWSGQVAIQEILTICIERDPAQLSAGSLRQLIEEGAAGKIAQMMIDSAKIFPALVELLAHERWSVRLGAMVAVEYLTEDAPQLAAGLATPLWQRMAEASHQAQGDMVHVIGQLATSKARTYLQRVIEGDYAQTVVSAAIEALGEI